MYLVVSPALQFILHLIQVGLHAEVVYQVVIGFYEISGIFLGSNYQIRKHSATRIDKPKNG